VKVNLRYVDSETLENESYPEILTNADAILVPGGFGKRGVEGMMRAIQYAREKRVPFFGSASASRRPSSSSRATLPDSRGPTRPSSTRSPGTR
jgi:hypothetical protein